MKSQDEGPSDELPVEVKVSGYSQIVVLITFFHKTNMKGKKTIVWLLKFNLKILPKDAILSNYENGILPTKKANWKILDDIGN